MIDVRAVDAALRGRPDVDTVDAGVTGVAGFPKKEARCIETGSGRFVVVDKWWWSRSVGGRVRRSVSGGARTNDRQTPATPPLQIYLSLDEMAFLPADSRENFPVASERLRSGVEQTRWEFPFVAEGPLTTATLVNKDGKFKWTHVLQDKGWSV